MFLFGFQHLQVRVTEYAVAELLAEPPALLVAREQLPDTFQVVEIQPGSPALPASFTLTSSSFVRGHLIAVVVLSVGKYPVVKVDTVTSPTS